MAELRHATLQSSPKPHCVNWQAGVSCDTKACRSGARHVDMGRTPFTTQRASRRPATCRSQVSFAFACRYQQLLRSLTPSRALLHEELAPHQVTSDDADVDCVAAHLSSLVFGHIPELQRSLREAGQVSPSGWTVCREGFVTACQSMAALAAVPAQDIEKMAAACAATFATGVSVADVVTVVAIACERQWLAELDVGYARRGSAPGSTAAAA